MPLPDLRGARNTAPTRDIEPTAASDVGLAGRGVVLIALALAVVSLAYLYNDYTRTVSALREATAQRANAFLSTLEAGIQVHVRRGRSYMEDRLETFLLQLVGTSAADAIEVAVLDGPTIIRVGDTDRFDEIESLSSPDPSGDWASHDGRVAFTANVEDFGRPHHSFGHGAPPHYTLWEQLPAGPYRLIVILDTTEMERNVQAATWRFVFSSGVAFLACILGAVLIRSWQRRRSLMTELIVIEERAGQQAQLAQLSAGLAHETKNPLGVVRGLAQSIVEAPDVSGDARAMARDIVDEVDRTVGQLNSFLSFAKPPDPRLTNVPLDSLLDRLLPLFEAEAHGAGVSFSAHHADSDGPIQVMADEGLLRRALLNLTINAVRACSEGGTVTISTEPRGGELALHIDDDGVGIAPEDLARVTDPYFTRFDGGTGLGLSIVKRIANAHGWNVEVSSELGAGTRVSLVGLRRSQLPT